MAHTTRFKNVYNLNSIGGQSGRADCGVSANTHAQFESQPGGSIALWAGNCLDSETTIPQPCMAETYKCPIRNSAL